MRIFSIRRAALAIVLGFLIPLGYAFSLSLAGDYTGWRTPEFMVWPFGWPRPLWITLMGRQPAEGDVLHGILFLTLANVALYGSLVYAALTLLPLFWRKSEEPATPPPPPGIFSEDPPGPAVPAEAAASETRAGMKI